MARAYLSKVDKEQAVRAVLSRQVARRAQRRERPVQRVRINDYPTIGAHKALVILVAFSDTDFSTVDGDPFGYYDGLLNQPGFTYKNGPTAVRAIITMPARTDGSLPSST